MGIKVYLKAFSLTGQSLLPVSVLASFLCIHTLGTASRWDSLGSSDCRALIFTAEAEVPGGQCQVSLFKMVVA